MGGWGGVVCTVIFMSNPTVVLCCVGVRVGVLTITFTVSFVYIPLLPGIL